MKTLREYIGDAEKKHVAIGHFNFSTIETLHAMFQAAKEINVPVIAGTSEGERDFVGVHQAVALVRSLREEHDYPIFLNADHTYSVERAKEAIDAGYDSVIFDGAKLSFEENVALTKECVIYARKHANGALIEGELGYIGTSSKLLDAIPEGAEVTEEHLTKPEVLKAFVTQTGVDLAAPAVGNLHGMLKSGQEPALDIPRIRALRECAGVPLVLHGGSGTSNADFTNAIAAGISIVHINTELRVAYRQALQIALQENMEEIAPYKILKGPMQSMEKVIAAKLRLFSSL